MPNGSASAAASAQQKQASKRYDLARKAVGLHARVGLPGLHDVCYPVRNQAGKVHFISRVDMIRTFNQFRVHPP